MSQAGLRLCCGARYRQMGEAMVATNVDAVAGAMLDDARGQRSMWRFKFQAGNGLIQSRPRIVIWIDGF